MHGLKQSRKCLTEKEGEFMYFIDILNLEEMEFNEQWEKIRLMLYSQWQENQDDIGILIRLACECWYVMSNWDCYIDTNDLIYEQFKDNLIATYEYGLEHIFESEEFLCIFGYMISLFPYFFYYDKKKNNQYSDFENKGLSMLEKAYKNSSNLLTKVFFLGTTNNVKEYEAVKADLNSILLELFPGETAVEKYFKDILTVK